ncbi:MAG: phosphatidic acid phosphatase [Verrucomicrobia bacterium]|nr:MAG: phosphatidic acid phosphatase [Verrucomicrobiota bacterium]
MTNVLFLPQNFVTPLALANPLGGADHELATWFHERLTPAFVAVLHAFTDFGSGEWIGIVVFGLVLFFAWKRWWPSLVTFVVAVPGGMLLNEWVKILVHRQRPFAVGPFVDWSGYSFASGHTIGATLLYGQLLLLILPCLKARHWRLLSVFSALSLIGLVGFSRVALGAHFLTDVLAAILFGIIWLALCVVLSKPIRRGSLRSQSAAILSECDGLVLVPVERVAQRDSNL